MERKLASVRKILNIRPIDGADMIEVATVDGWQVVVAKKDNFKVGQDIIFFEVDSFLPLLDEFEFLKKSSLKKMNGIEGYRLKTIKLRNTLSQGLIMPIELLNKFGKLQKNKYNKLELILK